MRVSSASCVLAILATLSACGPGGQLITVRTARDGALEIDARAKVGGGLAVFECLHSASNRCYFTLFPRGCAPGDGSTGCSASMLGHFSVAVDGRHAVRGLSAFRMCVSTRPGQLRPDCSLDEADAVARATPGHR